MSEMSGKYKRILEDLEKNIQDPQELEFVKEKFADLAMMFIDIIDRLTNITDARIEEIEKKQKEITNRINHVQAAVNGIENDIYEDEGSYEFEIVCPYCNYEFTADIEDEKKETIQCPECHNTIELDWNQDEYEECTGSCSSCASHCVSEDSEKYNLNKENETNQIEDNQELKDRKEQEDEDM